MSIRPIDIQIAIQKTDQYIKQFNTNTKITVQQQDVTNEIQKQVTRDQKQVVATSNSKHKKVDQDSQDKSGSRGKRGKEKRRQREGKGNNIDIIV